MAPEYNLVRVRLVQVRERAAVIAEEQASVRARTGLPAERFAVTSALSDRPHPGLLDGVDAVIIGGAGAYSVTDTFPWTDALAGLCHACADRGVPLFGSCWGHQFVARAFGGRVVHDPDRAELGTHDIELTSAGRADPLFSTLPARFGAQMGHHDRVEALPPGAVELARNACAPFQAFRLGGAPVYGTQFHSELDAETLRARMVAYRAHYPEMGDDSAFGALLASVRPSPAADDLLRRFLLLYAVEGGAERLAGEADAAERSSAASRNRAATVSDQYSPPRRTNPT